MDANTFGPFVIIAGEPRKPYPGQLVERIWYAEGAAPVEMVTGAGVPCFSHFDADYLMRAGIRCADPFQ